MDINKASKIIYDYYRKCGQISNLHADLIAKTILSSRYLCDEFTFYPEFTLEKLKKQSYNINILYIPVDLIELRYILKTKNEQNLDTWQKCYFTLDFAKKHLLDNSILLGYEVEVNNYGQIGVQKKDAKPELKRIVFRQEMMQNGLQQSIKSILKEENIEIEINSITSNVSSNDHSGNKVI